LIDTRHYERHEYQINLDSTQNKYFSEILVLKNDLNDQKKKIVNFHSIIEKQRNENEAILSDKQKVEKKLKSILEQSKREVEEVKNQIRR